MKPLKPGDIVDIVAPASRCKTSELKAAVRELKSLGLVPRVPAKIFGTTKIIANTDHERARQLFRALNAPDSRMVWCVRGGYGAIRLLPEIAKWRVPKTEKIFLGYSDITTLHAVLNQHWGWVTWHGPLLDRLGRGDMAARERRSLIKMMFGEVDQVTFSGLRPLNRPAKRKSEIRSRIFGGNLTVIQSGLGTPYGLDPRQSILFLEDTGERPYRVDRMLTQLSQSGLLKSVKAIVFGYFQLIDSKDRTQMWKGVIKPFSETLKIPVFAGLPVGHDRKMQMTLPLGSRARLSIGSAEARLEVSTGISAP